MCMICKNTIQLETICTVLCCCIPKCTYLLHDGVQVSTASLPEVNLDERTWVLALQQWLGRALLEDVSHLVAPVDHHRLHCMHQLLLRHTAPEDRTG